MLYAVDIEVELAALIRDVALRTRGVLAISSGIGYKEATYGPGVTIEGVAVTIDSGHVKTNVHIVVAEAPIPELSLRLRRGIQKVLRRDGRTRPGRINVYVDDMELTALSVPARQTV
jgi:hypothetical protein